jgi:hypothetical protein
MKKKRLALIVSGKTVADACPNCMHRLDGMTAARLDGPFERTGPTRRVSLKGNVSMCVYCGAMLVFADDEGHLRTMTAAERSTYHLEPVLQDIMDKIRSKRPNPPDFTRKNFN